MPIYGFPKDAVRTPPEPGVREGGGPQRPSWAAGGRRSGTTTHTEKGAQTICPEAGAARRKRGPQGRPQVSRARRRPGHCRPPTPSPGGTCGEPSTLPGGRLRGGGETCPKERLARYLVHPIPHGG